MKKFKSISKKDKLLFFMAALNMMILFFLTMTIIMTQYRVVEMQEARGFLRTLKRIPASPWERMIVVAGVCLIMFCCIYLKRQNIYQKTRDMIIVNVIEIITAVSMMFAVDMNYSGVVFFVVAEMLVYVREEWNKILFLILAVVCYIFCNYNLITLLIPMNSYEMWTAYYPEEIEKYFLALKAICEITNIVSFLIYVVYIMLEDKEENQRIKVLNERLHLANEQLHEYAQEKELMGETRERNRLAREIHDTLGHILTGISVGVEAAKVLVEVSPEAALDQLDTIGNMASRGLNDVRRSVRKLKPDVLEDQALDVAIHQMVEDMAKGTNTKIYFVSYGKNLHYEADEEEAIYRMVQEGITNAIRHGKATEIWIRLTLKEDVLTLILSDNGIGCSNVEEGFGLKHIRERVELLNGEIQFESLGGFNIIAKIPLRIKKEGKSNDKSDDSR